MYRVEKCFTVPELLALVEARHALSVRGIGRRVGVSPTTISAWRDGRAVPNDNHGLTLAALADLDPVWVLICLAVARSDCPDGRSAWRGVLVEHLQSH